MRLFHFLSIVVLVFLIAFFAYRSAPHYRIIRGNIFGTTYKIKIRTDRKDSSLESKIKETLEKINQEMSVFEETSEISALNRLPKGKRHELSKDLAFVLRAAETVFRQTEGVFDPTLAPLIDLWGFGTRFETTPPAEEELSKALSAVGFHKLSFFEGYRFVSKKNTATRLNLSGIAKGFAVDKTAEFLEREGYENFVVEIGGEIKTKGTRTDQGEAWNIGLNRPVSGASDNMVVLSIGNMAVATSGNYRNFYLKDGKTFGHILSSKTGKPVETDILSVSVFHESCMYADAYATALLAMGSDKALEFASKHRLHILLIDKAFHLRVSEAAKDIL